MLLNDLFHQSIIGLLGFTAEQSIQINFVGLMEGRTNNDLSRPQNIVKIEQVRSDDADQNHDWLDSW
jgi:hypothetical protein